MGRCLRWRRLTAQHTQLSDTPHRETVIHMPYVPMVATGVGGEGGTSDKQTRNTGQVNDLRRVIDQSQIETAKHPKLTQQSTSWMHALNVY